MSKIAPSSRSKSALSAFVVLLLATVALPALGQDKVRKAQPSRDQVYVFDDDPLDAVGMSDRTARVRVRPNSGRVLLIRPRAHFVVELERSVENL